MPHVHTLSNSANPKTNYVNYHHGRRLVSWNHPRDPQAAGAQLRELVPFNDNPNFRFNRPSLEETYLWNEGWEIISRHGSQVSPEIKEETSIPAPRVRGRRGRKRAKRRPAPPVTKSTSLASSPSPIGLPSPSASSQNAEDPRKKISSARAGKTKPRRKNSKRIPWSPDLTASKIISSPPKARPGRPKRAGQATKETAAPLRRSARVAAVAKKAERVEEKEVTVGKKRGKLGQELSVTTKAGKIGR